MKNSPIKKPSKFELSRFLLGECTTSQKQVIQRWIDSGSDAYKEFSDFKKMIQGTQIPHHSFAIESQKSSRIGNAILLIKNIIPKSYSLSWVYIPLLLFFGIVFYLNHTTFFRTHTQFTQKMDVIKKKTEANRLHDTLEILIGLSKSLIENQHIQCDLGGIMNSTGITQSRSFNKIVSLVNLPLCPTTFSAERTKM